MHLGLVGPLQAVPAQAWAAAGGLKALELGPIGAWPDAVHAPSDGPLWLPHEHLHLGSLSRDASAASPQLCL